MIPAGAIAAAAVAAARIAASRRKKQPGQPGPDGSIGTWALFVWTVITPSSLMFVVALLGGQIWALVPLAAVLAITFPWPISRALLVPLGLPRVAYWLTWTSDLAFHLDRRGGAALAAAWALAMQRERDEATAEWIAARLAAEAPLRGAGVAASALLLAARGDRDGARTLFATVEGIDDRVCPPEARRVASAWLASDAAERGAWSEAAERGATLFHGGRLTWLLAGIAQALLLEPTAPSPPALWLRWALAPHHKATMPMVRRAIDALAGVYIDPEQESPLAPAPSAGEPDALRAALSLHAAVLSRPVGALRADDVRAAGQAWDAVLGDRGTERRLDERALVLGAGSAAATLFKVRGAVEEDLASAVLASGLPLRDLGDTGELTQRVRARLRDQMLSEVEALADALKRRVDDKRALPAPDEWREWANLAARYARGVSSAGVDFRRLSFVKVYPDACSYAVWLFNDRKERPLGNAVFRWLLAEAEALDDQRAVALQTKNVGCGV